MNKLFSLLSVVLIAVFSVHATNNASFNWFLSGGSTTENDKTVDVVTDASGNIFLANIFLNSVSFNNNTFTGSAKGSGYSYDNSLLVTKLSPSKTTLWTVYSNDGVVTPIALATTPTGDLIVTGTIRAVVNTAGQTTTANLIDAVGTVTTFTGLSSAYVQSFVAKFNSNGVIQWVKELNSSATKDKAVTTQALATDANGNVYLTAVYTSSIVLPAASPISLTSTNTAQAAVIAKLDGTTGNTVWTKTSSGAIVSETITGLAYGDDGYLYAAGIFRNATTPIAVTIGNKNFTPSKGYDLTLIHLDTDGNINYVQNRSNTMETVVKDIYVNKGRAFIAGYFIGNGGGIVIPGGTPLTSACTYKNGYVLTFNTTDGADLWQKAVLSAFGEMDGLTVGNDGNLYVFGWHYNKLASTVDIDFGNGFTFTDANNGSGDLFLSSYAVSTGITQEVHRICQGNYGDIAVSLSKFGNNLYLGGSSNSSSLVFENAQTFATSGYQDFLLIDYAVINPNAGVNSIGAAQLPNIYADNANRQLVLTNADYIKYIKMFDATGRIVKTQTNSNNKLNMSTQGIASGVYILKLFAINGNVSSQRFVIQ